MSEERKWPLRIKFGLMAILMTIIYMIGLVFGETNPLNYSDTGQGFAGAILVIAGVVLFVLEKE